MSNLLTLLLHSSLCLILMYLVYWVFLKNDTYFISNRVYLLFAIISSVLIPALPIQYTVLTEVVNSNLITEIEPSYKALQPNINSNIQTTHALNWLEILFFIYISGAVILFSRLLFQTTRLLFLVVRNKKKILDGLHIVVTEKYDLPFSFFNVVFLHPTIYKQENLPEILAHEKVHIREKHWVDLLIIELLTVIFWFNPIIWFFEHSIKLNHEYLADHGVIANGNHIGKYQALLINQLMGIQVIGFANNLNFGINTNRFKMMTKQKTPKIKKLKLTWAIPALAILLFAFANPNYEVKEVSLAQAATTNKDAKDFNFKGKVVDENKKAMPGVSVLVKGTTLGTVTDTEGNLSINLSKKDQLVFSYVGMKTLTLTEEDLFFMNNRITMKRNSIYLDQNILMDKKYASTKKTDIPTSKKKGEEVFVIVEQMPEYPGGFNALGNFINKMKQSKSNIKGNVKIGFTIDENGNPSNVRIIEKDNDTAASFATKIVHNMSTWKPGKQRGKAVPVDYILRIEF